MHQVLASQNLLPKVETKTGEKNMPQKNFNAAADSMWNNYFYMRKIRWFVRKKKNFDFSINTDGVAVSLQYSRKKKEKAINNELPAEIEEKLQSCQLKQFAGIDTGYRNWNNTVTHEIATGKEVSLVYELIICVSMKSKCYDLSIIHFFLFIFRRIL